MVTEGLPLAFTVVAVGSAPLSYQWFKGATPIPGATGPALSIPDVRMADAGEKPED